MHRSGKCCCCAGLCRWCGSPSGAIAFAAPPKGVQVVADEANRRVDITIDGQPFTSYIWPTTLKKPVLYPIIDADGVTLRAAGRLSRGPASALIIRTTMASGSTTAT